MHKALFVALFALFLGASASPVQATSPLAKPVGPVVLEISGRIEATNAEGVARFDREMLEAMGLKSLTTSTAWTAGTPNFQGVLLRDLFELVGAEGSIAIATALNDYQVSISMEQLRNYPVMIALKMDGDYLKMRDKGPLWIVYPRDQHGDLQNSETDKKWIWQLASIRID